MRKSIMGCQGLLSDKLITELMNHGTKKRLIIETFLGFLCYINKLNIF